MSQDSADILWGALGLAGFLIVAFAGGKLLYAIQNSRLTKAWAPLAPIIHGTVTGDGGGAATSWLTGTYRGRRVQAGMSPNSTTGDSSEKFNRFDVAIMDVAGRADWSVAYETAFLGFGQTGWHLRTPDPELEAALAEADVVSRVRRFGNPKVEYRKSERTLRYSEEVTPDWAPSPDRFTAELDFLLELLELNETANRPH